MQSIELLTESLDRVLRDLFGDVRREADRARNIRDAIRRKFREIERLYDSLEKIPVSVKETCTAESLAASFRKRHPYLYVSDAGTAAGIFPCFDVGVKNAPFFLSTGDGVPLYATAPVNELAIRMNASGLLGMVFRDMTCSDFVPDDPHPMMVSTGSYGHPHANEPVDETGSMVLLDYRNLCFGTYGADDMFDAVGGTAQFGLLVDRLHSWMTDVNIDSMYSSSLSPVGFEEGYVDDILVPACRAVQEKTREFMRSQEYLEFVRCNRAGRQDGPHIYARTMNVLLGNVATRRTPVEWCVERCRRAFIDLSESPGGKHSYLNLAAHNILCAVLVLADKDRIERRRGGTAVVNGALGDLSLIPAAYAEQCRLDALGLYGAVVSVSTLGRYLEHYETVLDRKY